MTMQTVTLKEHPELARVIRAASPKYAKHKAQFNVAPDIALHGTYWDGGSRSTYTAVRIADCFAIGAPQYAPPQFGGPREAPIVVIPSGVAIVETGIFCGKQALACVTIGPDDATKFLPA